MFSTPKATCWCVEIVNAWDASACDGPICSRVMFVFAVLVFAVGLEMYGMFIVSPGPPFSSASPYLLDSTKPAATTVASTASLVSALQSSGIWHAAWVTVSVPANLSYPFEFVPAPLVQVWSFGVKVTDMWPAWQSIQDAFSLNESATGDFDADVLIPDCESGVQFNPLDLVC